MNVIEKRAIGSASFIPSRNEQRILERLAGIEGIPQLASGIEAAHLTGTEDNEGILLSQIISFERLDVNAVLILALQLTQIIAAVHQRGVIHKSIHPGNILLFGPERKPTLIGFDLATTFSEEQPGFVHHSMIAGMLAYISPEQTGRSGLSMDYRTDLYSFGVTLYELVVGEPPFVNDDPLHLIRDHLATVPVPPMELVSDLPPALSDIILRLLEKAPDRRYQSPEGLAHDLSRLLETIAEDNYSPFHLGQHDFPLWLSPSSRVVGREADVTALQAAFEEALLQRKRGVLVSGSPGVGKTALINTLRPFVTARRGWFISGKFDQLRQDQNTDAMRQALRALGRLLLAESEAELTVQRARMLEALGSNAGLVAAMLPEFALVLGVSPAAFTEDILNAEGQLTQAILGLLRAIVSPTRPLVIVIDDLQWAPVPPMRLFNAIVMDEHLRGLLLVGAYRETEISATHPLSAMLSRWEQMEAPPLRLSLKNLPQDNLAVLLGEMLRLTSEQAAILAEAVEPRTGGNPFDTVELINALRRDGVLVQGETGWSWDAGAIRSYVGQSDVIGLLEARINRLPVETQALMEIMACLGGELSIELLQIACDLPALVIEEKLVPALDDGLLVMMPDGDGAVRFRHDRVQQAAYGRLELTRRCQLHLTVARRLALQLQFEGVAADQYLAAIDQINDPSELRSAARLFHTAAVNLRLVNYVLMERFLAAALKLLQGVATAGDASLLTTLEIERHLALYSLGYLEEADEAYRLIESRCDNPLDLAEATCLQVASLTHRTRQREAVDLGLAMLSRLGTNVPQDLELAMVDDLDKLSQSLADDDSAKPEATDQHVVSVAKLLDKLVIPTLMCDRKINAWLALESQRLWAKHGPCAALVRSVALSIPLVLIAARQNYKMAYTIARRTLEVGESRGYDVAAATARHVFAIATQHWFGPLEDSVSQAREAHEALVRGGDLQFACLTYNATMPALLDTAPTLESCSEEVEAGLAFALNTNNKFASLLYTLYRQLLRSLQVGTNPAGSFTDASFDEVAHQSDPRTAGTPRMLFHTLRALSAAFFGDTARLALHSAAAMPLFNVTPGFYPTMWAHLLNALAQAQQLQEAPAHTERVALLAGFDASRDWLACRAADAPFNFLHLLLWLDAERAWMIGDEASATRAFDAALVKVESCKRQWHRALMTERAGLFHLAHGMEFIGRHLLVEAYGLYQEWGSTAKVQQLEKSHHFLRTAISLRRTEDQRGRRHIIDIPDQSIDLLAVLRVSQILSSETNFEKLKARVVELMGAMTGATKVLLVLRRDNPPAWYLSTPTGNTSALSLEEAGARGLLSLSAFRFVERTGEPLWVEDATRDDRFASDPYMASADRCSLLVVPILNHGVFNAILLLENRLSSGSFSHDRLDAVKLVAGQLAVSLENAHLYTELETRVEARTKELREAQLELVTTARRAGMAEIATNVLHNVGNVLNSVNVSADLIGNKLRAS